MHIIMKYITVYSNYTNALSRNYVLKNVAKTSIGTLLYLIYVCFHY